MTHLYVCGKMPTSCRCCCSAVLQNRKVKAWHSSMLCNFASTCCVQLDSHCHSDKNHSLLCQNCPCPVSPVGASCMQMTDPRLLLGVGLPPLPPHAGPSLPGPLSWRRHCFALSSLPVTPANVGVMEKACSQDVTHHTQLREEVHALLQGRDCR